MLGHVSDAITATEAKLEPALVGVLGKVLEAAGVATAKRLVKQLRVAWLDPKTGVDDHGRLPKETRDRNKVALAKASHVPATAAKQRWAEGNERTVSSMLGGKGTDDNSPTDVTTTLDGQKHGVEVKTLLEGKRDKITMHPDSLKRKETWGRRNKAELHTVVFDDRKAFGTTGYSGHRIYYRRGVGSYHLKGMTKVRSTQHLKQLMVE